MPPASAAMRKASLISNSIATLNDPSSATGNSSTNARRTTTSGRAIRTNTTRPTNYYARPFALNGVQDGSSEQEDATPPGFFPALTYFSDAITALPKEVMRQFTLMKEVEAKIHGPTERLGEVVDGLMVMPVPRRRDGHLGAGGGLLSFTANNSVTGSANASLVNGVAPYGARSGQNSTAGSTTGDEPAFHEMEEDLARRRQTHELRMLTHTLLPNMDEKQVVLAEALRVLENRLSCVDEVMPYIEAEIPEDARLGSMTHWAYSDNRQKTKTATQSATERNRRDVAATNNLAAAASAVYETEVVQARREAGKEATREKIGRGRNKDLVDSEFEDKPRKGNAKAAKAKAAAANATLTGLGISTNGESVKRRKVDKGAATAIAAGGGTGMERQVSSTGRGAGKAARETPRGTPVASEMTKKTSKAVRAIPAPPQLPKKKGPHGAQGSPALASSPLQTAVNLASSEPPATARPQSARMRQNSSTNLRYERLADETSTSRPASAAGATKPNTNGEKANSKKRSREDAETKSEVPERQELDKQSMSVAQSTEVVPPESESISRPAPSRSGSSTKNSGRASKMGTPRSENIPAGTPQQDQGSAAMVRTRSTRSVPGNVDTASAEPPLQAVMRSGHKRSGGERGSVSGLMKQIAPFNKSPDIDRHSRRDDMDNDLESGEEGEDPRFGDEPATARRTRSRPTSIAASRPVSQRQRSERRSPGDDDVEDQDEIGVADQEMVDDVEGDAQGELREDIKPASTQSVDMPVGAAALPVEEVAEDEVALSAPASSPASPPVPSIPDLEEPASPTPSQSEHQIANEEADEEDIDDLEDEVMPPNPEILNQGEEVDGDESEPDPDDPNEPKYCYCNRGSYGDMVGCDNPECPREWFHLGCTDLADMPGEEESWFCEICRPRGERKSGRGRGGRGAGRGRTVKAL